VSCARFAVTALPAITSSFRIGLGFWQPERGHFKSKAASPLRFAAALQNEKAPAKRQRLSLYLDWLFPATS
jgi:hypothetical protein